MIESRSTPTIRAFGNLSDLAKSHGKHKMTAYNWRDSGKLLQIRLLVGHVNHTGKGMREIVAWYKPSPRELAAFKEMFPAQEAYRPNRAKPSFVPKRKKK